MMQYTREYAEKLLKELAIKELLVDYPESLRPLLDITVEDITKANAKTDIAPNPKLFKNPAFKARLILIGYWLRDKEEEYLVKYGGRDDKNRKPFYGYISDCGEKVLSNHDRHLHYTVLQELGYIDYELHQRFKEKKVKKFRLKEQYRRGETFKLSLYDYFTKDRTRDRLRKWLNPYTQLNREWWPEVDQWLWDNVKRFKLDDRVLELLYTDHCSFISADQKHHLVHTYNIFKNNNQIYIPCKEGLGEGRVYSNVSGMSKKARNYLTVDGQKNGAN